MEGTLEGLYPDHDLALAEALQDQETADLPLWRNTWSNWNETSNRSFGSSNLAGQSSNMSTTISVQSQLVSDEALAKQWQAIEDMLANTSLNNLNATGEGALLTQNGFLPSVIGTNTAGPSSVNESNSSALQAIEQDNVDPDNMTYEERSSLTERMGNESKGLSDDLISCLPISEYKSGFFSRRNKSDKCVICQCAYRHRDELIILYCDHCYHAKCISTWLRLNKACPICKYEVFG